MAYEPLGGEFLVNTSTSGDQLISDVTALIGGGYVICWSDLNGDGSGYAVKARLIGADGTPIGAEWLVNSTTAADQKIPAVAALDNGGFAITWYDYSNQSGDSSGSGVIVRLYGADGTPVSGEILVNTITTNDQVEPYVAGLTGGGFVVTWIDYSNEGGDDSVSAVRAQVFASDGTPVGGEILVNTETHHYQIQPQISGLENGNFVITWTNRSGIGGDASNFGVKAQLFAADGTKIGGEFLVNTETANEQSDPTVTGLVGGGFVITWNDHSGLGGDSSGWGIRAQLYDANGTPVGGEFVVNTVTFDEQQGPTVAALPDGGFVISWMDYAGTFGGAGGGIKAQIFAADGTPVGGEFTVNTIDDDRQLYPDIAAQADGSFLITWISNGAGGDGSGYGIKAQLYVSDSPPANIAPVLDLDGDDSNSVGTGYTGAYSEGGAAAAIADTDITITDADAGDDIVSAVITISNPETGDILNVGTLPAGITVDVTSTATIVKLVGAPGTTADDFEAAIKAVTYWSTSDDPTDGGTNAARSITVVVNDGVGDSNSATATIAVTDGPLALGDTVWNDTDGDAARDPGEAGIAGVALSLLVDDGDGVLDASDVVVGTTTTDANGGYSFNGLPEGTYIVRVDAENFEAGGALSGMASSSGGDDPDNNVDNDDNGIPVADAVASRAITLNADSEPTLGEGHNTNNTVDFGFVPEASDVPGYQPLGSEFLVNTETDGRQHNSMVASLDGGGFVVSWIDWSTVDSSFGSEAGVSLKAQLYDDGGSPIGGEILVTTLDHYNDWFEHPAIASLAGGGFVISWGSLGTPGPGVSTLGSDFQIFSADGSPVGDVVRFHNETSQPTITGLNDGGFVIGWQVGNDVVAQLYAADGTAAAPAFLVHPESETNQYSPALGTLADGRFVVAWQGDGAIHAKIFGDDGTPTGPAIAVGTAAGAEQMQVSIAGLIDGGFVVSWTDRNSATGDSDSWAVKAQLFGAEGSPVGGEFLVNSTTLGQQSDAVVTALASGSFVITWSDQDTSYAGTGNPPIEIRAQLYAADGSAVGGEFTVNTVLSSVQYEPFVAGLATGGFVASWTDFSGLGGDNSDTSIKAQIYAALAADGPLVGDGNDNTITGTPQSDLFLVQQGGNDTVSGLASNDEFYFGGALTAADVVDGGADYDTLVLQGDYSGGLALTGNVTGIEAIELLAGANTTYGDPGTNLYDYSITVADAAFAAGLVTIDGSNLLAGEDLTFDGSAESDCGFLIYAGRGTDSLTGGAQNDIFIFGDGGHFGAGDTVNGGPGGYDVLNLRGDYTVDFSAWGFGASALANIDSINLASGGGSDFDYVLTWNDALLGSGQTIAVDGSELWAGETMSFDGSSETDGHFQLFGGAGEDVLTGGSGNDILAGFLDADTLTGGAGNDTFRYYSAADSTAAARDAIQDFTPGDIIDLSEIDADTGTAGKQAFSFVGNAAFSNTAGELRFEYVSGSSWLVQGDVNGDGVSDFETIVIRSDAGSMTSSDFLLTEGGENAPADAQDDAFTNDGWHTLTGNLFDDNGSGPDSDPDGPPLAVTEVNGSGGSVGNQITLASGAHLTVNSDGTFYYAPNVSTQVPPGSDSFTYTLAGGDTATVTLTIENADAIVGNNNGNRLIGGNGDDAIYGLDGNDYITGGFGDDLVNGGAGGSDRAGWYQTNEALGGATVDLRLQGQAQNTGSQGWDTLVGIENLSGTPFADSLTGDGDSNWLWGSGIYLFGEAISTSNNDALDGQGGDDLLIVGQGNHTLIGGSDTDTVQYTENGGPEVSISVDLFQQGGAQDTGAGSWILIGIENVSGGSADDFLQGDGLANILAGAAGSDIINGGGGNDILAGDGSIAVQFVGGSTGPVTFEPLISRSNVGAPDGNDQLSGGAGDDTLYGGGGNDTLRGGNDSDTIYGGTGDDLIVGGFGDDLIDGGDGFDRAGNYHTDETLGGVTIDLNIAGPQDTGSQGWDTIISIEYLSGTPFADVLIGDSNANVLWGSIAMIDPGSNWISTTNDDTLDGGGGDDLLVAGIGYHSITGGDGIDTFLFTENWGDDPAIRISLALQGAAQDTGQGLWTLNGIENLSGGDDHDELTGDENANILAGSFGDDTLGGGGGNDLLYGDGAIDTAGISTGAPTVFPDVGANGNDTLEGGLGDDLIDGGGGVDTASYANASGGVEVVLYRNGGGNGDSTGADGEDFLTGIENLTGSAHNDQLAGNNLANVIDGGQGNDGLRGNDGDDTLLGGDGNDFLNAGLGNDVIDGGDGFDRAAFYEDAGPGGVTVDLNLQGQAQETGQGMDTLIGIENVSGSVYGDTLIGDDGDNQLWGSASTLTDGTIVTTNNDTLSGGGGNDLLQVGIGNHVVDGGSGTDTFRFTENGAAETGITLSLLLAGQAQASGNGNWTLTNIENLSGSAADDQLTGDDSANVLAGDRGGDVLVGSGGNDTLYGDGAILVTAPGSGPIETIDDVATIGGASGDDTMEGGLGDDWIDGGGGTDTASYANAAGGVQVALFNNLTGDGSAGGADGDDLLFSIENLTGSAFNDTFTGSSAANILIGGAGNDFLQARGGDDTVYGGDGNDYLGGGTGNDLLDGGAGWDRASFSNGSTGPVTVDLRIQGVSQNTGLGVDTLIGIEHVTGSAFGDTLTGDDGANWLWGGTDAAGVTDTIDGQGGDDLIENGVGDHNLSGGGGIDTFSFNPFTVPTNATISLALQGAAQNTGAGTMTLAGFENLSGSSFTDTLIGDGNANMLAGGEAGDILTGGGGDDTLYGDGFFGTNGSPSGPITVFSDVGTLGGIVGDDTLEGGLGNDTLDGGGGDDTATYASAAGSVTVNLAAGTSSGADGNDTLSGIENAIGGAYNDTLVGNGVANILAGGDGHDSLSGAGGNDTLQGGDGNDSLTGGAGDDAIDGGAGFDRANYNVGATAGVTVNLGLTGPQNTGQGFDTLTNVEHVVGTIFNDIITGNDGANWLWGGSLGTGVTGNDTISGGNGNDLIEVGAGNHTLNGGGGTGDTLSFWAGGTDVTATGVSFSLASSGAQNTRQGTTTGTGFENLSGSRYGDALTGDTQGNILAGNAGNDTLNGGVGDDTLYGDGGYTTVTTGGLAAGPIRLVADVTTEFGGVAGNDTLNGGDGDDVLYGGGGNDAMKGDKGNDTLYGGTGNDSLVGGQGNDRYIIEANSGTDTISGFTHDDKIVFDTSTGVDSFSDLTLTASGRNTLITWGTGDSLLIEGLRPRDITAADIEFPAPAALTSFGTQEEQRALAGSTGDTMVMAAVAASGLLSAGSTTALLVATGAADSYRPSIEHLDRLGIVEPGGGSEQARSLPDDVAHTFSADSMGSFGRQSIRTFDAELAADLDTRAMSSPTDLLEATQMTPAGTPVSGLVAMGVSIPSAAELALAGAPRGVTDSVTGPADGAGRLAALLDGVLSGAPNGIDALLAALPGGDEATSSLAHLAPVGVDHSGWAVDNLAIGLSLDAGQAFAAHPDAVLSA